jgi:hypothetical protein
MAYADNPADWAGLIRMFLEDQPDWLEHGVSCIRTEGQDEPEPVWSMPAMKALLCWGVAKSIFEPDDVRAILEAIDRVLIERLGHGRESHAQLGLRLRGSTGTEDQP